MTGKIYYAHQEKESVMDPKTANIVTIIAGIILFIVGIVNVLISPAAWYMYVTLLAGIIVIIVGTIGFKKGKVY